MIYKILLSVSLSRNEEGNYLVHRWVMSPPRRQGLYPLVKTPDVAKEPTRGQLDDWLLRIFSKDRRLNDGMLKQRHKV